MDILTLSPLNEIELSELAQHEATIERGFQTFVEVGLALMAIRDGRLYRAEFGTFEEYCNERWGWGRAHAYRLIDAAQVVENVSNWRQNVAPATESQARPLSALEPEEQREAWQRAVETAPNGKVTAAHVEMVVKEMQAGPVPHVAQNSGDNEWYTPAEYIETARAVMGQIDLDPASTEIANTVVKARKFFTAQDNGLLYDWQGRVWMNPPYAQPLIAQFASRLREEWAAGRVSQAIVLVNNATETAWFQELVKCAAAVCFPLARVKFWSPDRIAAPLQGQAVLYLGQDVDVFIRLFGRFGWCAEVTR